MYINADIIPLTTENDWWKNTKLPNGYKLPDWRAKIKYIDDNYNGAEKMNELLKKYRKTYMSHDVATAYELGAMDEDGMLTPDGLELLCEIFYDNEEMQKIFYSIIDTMTSETTPRKEEKNGRKK